MTTKKEEYVKKQFCEDLVCNVININREQTAEINKLRDLNSFYREIINKQFSLLCNYSVLFKDEESSEQQHNYKDLCKVFEEYGLEKLSSEVLEEIELMSFRRER